ncbi:zinc-binding dehydrogenase [Kribbella sp. NPDC051586]|uniref:zinc-binding dehydrogenase n=1 Tax=Kribbella sp. NPDC051586 TaxID=3364118 RepID=UPI0037928FC7
MRGFITDPAAQAGLRLADDLPEPTPAPDESVVEVRAYAANHDELNLIARRPDGWRPGQDIAGVVVRAAADGNGPAAGTRVGCYLDWEGWAERVPVPAHCLAVLDDRVSFEQAATLPVAGLTALRALRVGGAVLGRKVLVTGATGGVGQFAVQLAVAAGAVVTAQVSSPAREAEARALGAHQVVTSLEDETLGPFHLVMDGIGGPLTAQAVRRIAAGGHLAWYGNIGGPAELRLGDFYSQGWNAHIVGFISPVPEETKGEDLSILAALVADGRLTPSIGLRVDWTKTPDALDALSRREFRGKAVMTVSDLR